MKRTKKQVLSLVTVGYLLVNTVVMSGAVFAETVPSEEVKTTSTSSPTSESLSSSLPNIPAPGISSSEPTVSSEAKEAARILSYEDNQLLEVAKADSATPAIVFQKKELENGLTIQGTVSAGRKENQSDTILSALILQRQAESGEWEDAHPFSIDEDGINLAENEFTFEYSEGVEKTGEVRYRLAADYAIKYSDAEQTQKGSLEIGTITKTEKKEPQEQTEESTPATQESSEAVQESTTESTQESSELTEQITVESSGPKEDSKQDEPIMVHPSGGAGTTSPSTLGKNNQIPKMADTYREAFQRGLGIMPMASAVVIPTTSNEYYYQAVPFAEFAKPVVISAQYTSKTRVTMKLRINWKYEAYSYYTSVANPEAEIDKSTSTNSYDFHLSFGETRWGKDGIIGQLNRNHMEILFGDGRNGNLDVASFVNSRIISQRVSESPTRYHYWSDNTTTLVISNIPTLDNMRLNYSMKYKLKTVTYHIDYYFGAPNVTDLSHISIPKFTATDEVTDSVTLEPGTYTGDVNDKTDDGIFQISIDNGAIFTDKIQNLEHETKKDGKYANGIVQPKITGLAAGTRYQGKVGLRDWVGNLKYSAPAYFYTPNKMSTPGAIELGEPTNANDASAIIKAGYQVGADPAHPQKIEVQLWSESEQKYKDVPEASSTFKLLGNSTELTYELKNLPANEILWTRVRVQNASEAWSAWSPGCKFKTKGVKLTIPDPTVNHALTKTNEVTLNGGAYKGHVTIDPQYVNIGEVWYHDGLGWTLVTDNLVHDTILDGTYKGIKIENLSVGTSYRAQVGFMDSENKKQFSKDKEIFYTLNTVDKPVINSNQATGKYNASADISGVYGIGPTGTTPAHPDKVQVQIRLDSSPTWEDIDGSTIPKLDSQSIDESSTKGNFTISKMKANKKYHVRYRVENKGGWSEWSESEEFTTLAGPPSMELINAPKFDFGMLKNENFPQTATLDAASTKNHVELENTILASGWKLTAKLDQLKRTDNPSIVMPWATLSMYINLQKSPDDGVSWSNYATGVIGSPRIVSINSGAAAVPLWSISDPQHSQGLFRTEIDWSKVKLNVPANQTGMYQGNLVWSLDDTP